MKTNKIDRKQDTKKLKSFLENEVFPELDGITMRNDQREAIKRVIQSKVDQQISYFDNKEGENPWEYVSIKVGTPCALSLDDQNKMENAVEEVAGDTVKLSSPDRDEVEFRIQLFTSQQAAPGIYTFELYKGKGYTPSMRKVTTISSHVILEPNIVLEPTEESLGNKLKSVGIPEQEVDEFLKENIEEIISPVIEKPYYIEIEHANSTLVMYELRTRPNIRFFPLLDITKHETISFKNEFDSVEFIQVTSTTRYVLKKEDK